MSPANLFLEAEVIRLRRERSLAVSAAKVELDAARRAAEVAWEEVNEAICRRPSGGTLLFEQNLRLLQELSAKMAIELIFTNTTYGWRVELRHGVCPSSVTIPMPPAPEWAEELWSKVDAARLVESGAMIREREAEAAARDTQVREDATLTVARRLGGGQ